MFAPRSRSLVLAIPCACTLIAACGPEPGIDTEFDTEFDTGQDEDVATLSQSIQNATPASATFLLAAVKVNTWRGMCSGTLIATDRVLTAAHCVCTENLVGGNVCANNATVDFRPNPSTGAPGPRVAGTVTWHPSYNPSWVDKELENDIAVIDLDADAPTYVTPIVVANSKPTLGSNVMIAGFGLTGSNCTGAAGTLNYVIAKFDRFVDDGRMLQFDDPVTCGGDSGGPILNTAGTLLYAVHSSHSPTFWHGWVGKDVLTQPYYSWIRSLTCSSNLWDRCDDKAEMCRCSAGIGDCDINADCKPSLRCAQNIGATFGYSSSVDVCVPSSGPIQGTCSCKNSGFGNVCTRSYNGCSAGFYPRCFPEIGTSTLGCGGCSCY